MKEFNVYFVDGNHKILEGKSILAIMMYLVELGIMNDVDRIERR